MGFKGWASAAALVVLAAAGPAAAQLPDLGGLGRDLVKDAVKDRAQKEVEKYLGINKEPPRPAPARPAPPPRRAPAVKKVLVDADDPEAVREVLSGWGSATLSTTKEGDPRISGRIEGALYTVRFFGCRRGASCEQIVFSAGFAETGATLDALNAWNRDKLFGRAFLSDGGEAVVEMPVNLRFGVSRENLDDTADLWRVTLLDFRDHVNEEPAKAPAKP